MSDTRERSGIFKFFYIVLSVITFPIFVVIYIFKHPFWVLFFVLLIGGVGVYYPLSKGVEIDKIAEWYKAQYMDKKLEIVTKAVESGNGGLVPTALIDEVQKTKKKLEDEKKESLREKGENYNDKVVRDEKFEEVAVGIRKKGGFKKKAKPMNSKESVETAIGEGVKAGGLGALFKKVEEDKKLQELVDESEGAKNPSDESMLELDALIGDIEDNALPVKVEEKVEEIVKPQEVVEPVEEEAKAEVVKTTEEDFVVGEVKEKIEEIVVTVDVLVKEVKSEVADVVDIIEPVEDFEVEIVEEEEDVVENEIPNVESQVLEVEVKNEEIKAEVKEVVEDVKMVAEEVKDVVVEEVIVPEVIEEISVEDVDVDIF